MLVGLQIVWLLRLPSVQEKPWALYKTSGGTSSAQGSADTPVEDKCEECFNLHLQAFFWIDWTTLCTRVRNDKTFSSVVSEAREAKAGRGARPAVEEEVIAATKIELELERSFICMNEKEMRRDAAVSRIPKMAIKNVPQLEVPAEGGGETETVYCFKNPDDYYRKLHVKVNIGCQHLKTPMPAKNFVYQDQGGDIHTWLLEATSAGNGVANLLEKEVHLVSWEDFKAKRLSRGAGDDIAEECEPIDEEQNACSAAAESYRGAAAAVSAPMGVLCSKPGVTSATRLSTKTSPATTAKKVEKPEPVQRALSFGGSPGDGNDELACSASVVAASSVGDDSALADGLTGHS
eukprot:6467795-Amphidinium_carterae.2